MKIKNKLIQSLFAIFAVVAIVSTGFANIVNVASANSNDDVTNADVTLEGSSYIIVHALNPEAIEIASIEGIDPDYYPPYHCVEIYDGDTLIGYGAHDNETYNKPIWISPGAHTIKVKFNGMALQQNVNITLGETRVLTFVFSRQSFESILSSFIECHDPEGPYGWLEGGFVSSSPSGFDHYYMQDADEGSGGKNYLIVMFSSQRTHCPLAYCDTHTPPKNSNVWLEGWGGRCVNWTLRLSGGATLSPKFRCASVPYDIAGTGIICEEVQPPAASFTYSPENPDVSEEITFDAASSYDPDGEIVNYNWNFGDGNSTEGKVVTHAYSKAGNYTVTLTVTDNDGLQDSTELSFWVGRPVLLIHGYHSNPGMWDSMASYLEGKGFIVERLDYSSGGANKKIRSYDLDLNTKIYEMRQIYSVDKIDIVAHSMGGLITRHYMKGFGENEVRKFIMIGTPNQGSELAYLSDKIIKILPYPLNNVADSFRGEAGKDMTPYSPFLNSLNYGNPNTIAGMDFITPNVEYYTIAGFDDAMGIPPDTIEQRALRHLIRSYIEHYLEGLDDTVVRVKSVELNNGVKRSYEVNEWHCNEGNNQEIQIIVEDILKGDSKSASAFSKFRASAKGEEEYSIQKVSEFSETIYQSQDRSYNVNISLANEASFPLFWDDGTLNLTLVTPNGTFIDPSVAESNPDIEYGYDANGTMQGYFIKNPESGNWTLNIHAVNTPEDGTTYSMVLLLNTTLILDSSQNGYVYRPNEHINITANLTNNGTAVTGALLVASIKRPDNTTETITLYDDGSHNDNESNDGIYANTYTNTSLWGTYDITITASGILNEEDFQREAFTTVWVEEYPDLTLNASDISFSSETPIIGENITINATIHNIGDADANNASILFYDGEPAIGAKIGEDVVNVSVNATANTSVSWIAKAGVHEIYVLISPYNEFLEENYTNNQAFKSITVAIANVTFDTGSPANPYPSIFGTHNGTIKPNQTITVNKLYTYPCEGTGGHTEIAMIWNTTIGECAVAEWNGYSGDYHNISFNKTLTLEEGVIYNYTIRTGSYPQIIHESPFNATGGTITCDKFIDANGKIYADWIPAIRLWRE